MKRIAVVAIAIVVLAILSFPVIMFEAKLQVPKVPSNESATNPTNSPTPAPTIAPTNPPVINQVHGRIVVPTDYSTIKEAVAHAADGATVFVRSGTYREGNITINRDISLIGENRETTIITSESSTAILSINQSQVTISEFTIKSADTPKPIPRYVSMVFPKDNTLTAIKIQLSKGCHISNNLIINSGRAIWIDSSSNNIVESNILRDNYYSIDVTSGCYPNGQKPWVDPANNEPSSGNLIRDNQISNSKEGICLEAKGNNNIICANKITTCERALDFVSGNNLNFAVGNYIYGNSYAVWFYGSSNKVLHHNNFVNNAQDMGAVEANLIISYSINIWDDGIEGNYWSNFSGSLYQLDDLNRDNYPLSAMVDINAYASYSSTIAPYPIPTYPPAPTPR